MTRIVYATVVSVIFGCFALLPPAQAVLPPPEGGYPGNNTAVGDNALQNLTTGTNNTALGFRALHARGDVRRRQGPGLRQLRAREYVQVSLRSGLSSERLQTTKTCCSSYL